MKCVFSVFDSKAGSFSTPFFSVNKAVALRDFGQAVNDQKSQLFLYPEDYILFELGSFDDSTGVISSHSTPINLGSAAQYKL